MKNKIAPFAMLSCLLAAFGILAQSQSSGGFPPPRAPERHRVTRVEELLPNARLLVRRPFSWLIGAQYGLGLKSGERLLLLGHAMDPLVAQALAKAAAEVGVATDVFARDFAGAGGAAGREEFDYERFDPARYLVASAYAGREAPDWLARIADHYDIVVGFAARGSAYGKIGSRQQVRSATLSFSTADQFASPAVSYPEELMSAIASKAWQQLIAGRSFRITDPAGTDLTFTIDDTNRDRLKQTRGMATYGKLSLERPVAHEASLQLEPQLTSKPDTRGVLVTRQVGLMNPPLRLAIEGGRVIRAEGGGVPGDNIRAALERFKDSQFPGFYPGPGVGWIEEIAIGTNPKVGPAGPMRYRSGLIQVAFGTDRHNTVTDQGSTLSANHRDMDLFYFPTLEVDGRKLIDRGRLTVLDDPEIRAIAARHGDPDRLLQEEWIPEFEEKSGRIVYPAILERGTTR